MRKLNHKENNKMRNKFLNCYSNLLKGENIMKRNIYILVAVLTIVFTSCSKEQLPGVSPYSPEKELMQFGFLKVNNPSLDKDYFAIIDSQQVNIEIPKSTDLSKLIPTFKISDKATLSIGNKVIESGVTPINLSNSLTFTVTAQNKTVRKYFPSTLLIGVIANPNINKTTSYNNYINNKLYIDLSTAMPITPLGKAYTDNSYPAIAYGDFDKDGDLDIVAGSPNPANSGLSIEYYKNNTFEFQKDQSVFTGGAPKMVGPSKMITGDFDGNGWLDVAIAGTGYTGAPYPGETLKVLMNYNGKFTTKEINIGAGYYASITAGDIDNDGDVDLFVTDNKTISKFLINDGKGNFTTDASLYPGSLYNASVFTSELYDINGDGFLDLVTGGFEQSGTNTEIFWGNASGQYLTSKMTTIPKIANFGVIVDISFIDYDKDGKTDILITRTGDGTGPVSYYKGYYLQLLKNNGTSFSDVTGTTITNYKNTDINYYIKKIRIQDVDNDGDLDITTDDKFDGFVWYNNNGKFAQ